MSFNSLFHKKTISQILKDSDVRNETTGKLTRNLNLRDLTALAIAAIIGAGIFSTIGNASASGGPAVSLLFIFTAIACSFSALCYAEFASLIPISGSAYTYAYATLGELFAWIIGWDLLMEYSVGNIAVAISWSDYFTSFLQGFGLKFPEYLSMDYFSASKGFHEALISIKGGTVFSQLSSNLQDAYIAWTNAPHIFSLRIIADVPAFFIVAIITILVFIGIKETKTVGNYMVLLKLIVIILIISIGAFYVQPDNWSPFAPNGFTGVLKGVSAVFFAYIGFDAISTTAEECKNPQKDLPKAMLISLVICTVLYVLITLILTGMVNYKELAVGDPLAFVFQRLHLDWLSGIIAFSAIVAMASVLLVFQVGQPRIWMSMGRDGLLPPKFASIHKRFKTPYFSTIITGIIVGIPCLFLNLTEVTDLTSIGTLFAFIVVCAGVLVMNTKKDKTPGRFKITYINSRYVMPFIFIGVIIVIGIYFSNEFINFFNVNDTWDVFKHKIPSYLFMMLFVFITILSSVKQFSLIPVLGLVTNLYLISELGILNWMRFLIWLVIGMVIYFTYSYKHSKLRKENMITLYHT